MTELKWVKGGRTVTAEGTTNTYYAPGTGLSVESRKRHIPHANRIGTWDYTSYFVLKDGKEVAEKHSLANAKKYAEQLAEEDPEARA